MSCCLKPADFGPVNSNQLHHFSNASEAAFGSVSYFKLVSHADRVHCSFLFEKSHVAPLKAILLSHLELSATTVSVRQDKTLKEELQIPLHCESVFWSESTCQCFVMWRTKVRASTRFFADRVAVLQEGSSPDQGRYVEGVANPGDCPLRALTSNALFSCQLWLLGPEFLWKSEEDLLGCLPRWRLGREDGLQGLSCLFLQFGASFGWVLSAHVFLAPTEEVSCMILTVPWKLAKVK